MYEQLTKWIDTKDFKSIAQYILNIVILDTSDKMLYSIYSVAIDIFTNIYNLKVVKTKLIKEFCLAQDRILNNSNIRGELLTNMMYRKRVVLLTKIMTLFSLKEKLVKGKNFYVVVEPESIIQYETIDATSSIIKHYKVLDIARICGIDDLKHLSLFRLERDTIKGEDKQLKDIYFGNWLYHAAFSPVWFNRIKQYRGYVDYIKMTVEFVDEDVMQMFYLKYGYEPDEQSQHTTDKCLKINDGINWKTFYEKFKGNGLFLIDEDEIEELNNDKIRYPVYF